jgi:hypothetical protein
MIDEIRMPSSIDGDLVKSHPKDGFVKSSRCKVRKN